MTRRPRSTVKGIDLALQGGGAHGAYTWGVLDRLLDEKNLVIHGISGTSAGAMNAAVMISGYRKGGAQGAKDALAKFWQQISLSGSGYANPFFPTPNMPSPFETGWNLDSTLPYQWFDMITRVFSPYQLNPFNINPLRTILLDTIDFDLLNQGGDMPLFVTATAVRTGRPRVFHCHEVTVDVLLASACIPFFFQAVEIDGEAYWDGGYVGNPSIWPLVYHTGVHDVLLVQINPIERPDVPMAAHDIINRLNEITFNTSLIDEMRAINFVSELVQKGVLSDAHYKDMRMHMIPAPDLACGLNASSKMNTDWRFFQLLKEIGYKAASDWLATNKSAIGKNGTLDIRGVFLEDPIKKDIRPAPKRKRG